MEEISIFKCNFCFHEWDEFESHRQYRLRKCCVCHDEICKTCFYNKDNKQKCFSCHLGNTPRSKNKCIINSLNYQKTKIMSATPINTENLDITEMMQNK